MTPFTLRLTPEALAVISQKAPHAAGVIKAAGLKVASGVKSQNGGLWRVLLRFSGVPESASPEFDRQVDSNGAALLFDGHVYEHFEPTDLVR